MRSSSGQNEMFFTQFNMTPRKLKRLEKTWAGEFRRKIYPKLLQIEKIFREETTRSNPGKHWVHAPFLGALLLKHHFDITDRKVSEWYDFHITWHKALNLSSHSTVLKLRDFYEFQRKFFYSERLQNILTSSLNEVVTAGGIGLRDETLDISRIKSTIIDLGIARLFFRTQTLFIRNLNARFPEQARAVPANLQKKYSAKVSFPCDCRPSEALSVLKSAAGDARRLVDAFKGQDTIVQTKSFELLENLIEESRPFIPDIAN